MCWIKSWIIATEISNNPLMTLKKRRTLKFFTDLFGSKEIMIQKTFQKWCISICKE